jgi:CheY-like chemotaxis protein
MSPLAIRIMMVDDEPDFLQPLAFWLQSKGYQVESLTSPLAAIERLQQATPDILFLDINMPELDGVTTLSRIRAFNPELPVVILTAAYDDREKFKAVGDLNIAGFFPKQNSLEQFGQMLQVTLRTHGRLQKDDS